MKRFPYLRWLSPLALAVILVAIGCTQGDSNADDTGIKFVKKEGATPGVVAKFQGKEITADDLEKSNPDIYAAKLEVYETQKRAIEEYVRQSVLEDLAKKANMSVDAFVKKEMDASKKKVSDKQVNAFLKERNVKDPDKVPEQIRDQVRGLIHMQDLVGSVTKKNSVELYLKRPEAQQLAFDFKDQPTWGKDDAKVTIVEFSDFQCPFCAQGKERLAELKKKYGKKIRIVYKNFPLPMHPDARPAAEAAMCVNEQSSDKFWKYHDVLFEHQDKLSSDDLKKYAKEVGVNEKKFDECFSAKKYASVIDASMEEARKFGVNSTPTFFVNSQPVRGAKKVSEFSELIDEALSSAKN